MLIGMRPPSTLSLSAFPSEIAMKRVLGGLSIFTLLMTVPQIVAIWATRQAAGVSVLSWGAYWISALIWFWYGVQKRDRNIYLPCIGWLVLDGAVVVGALIYG
jgi:uncharacterized protein with PQ loop repeat